MAVTAAATPTALRDNITGEPNAYWLSGQTDEKTDKLWSWLKYAPQTWKVTLTAAEIKALAADPIIIVPSPGENKYLEFISATLILDNGATDYADAAAQGNMVIRYTDGSGIVVSASIEADGFIDCAADSMVRAIPITDALVVATGCVNKPLVLDNDGGEFTTGTGTMIVLITVITRDVSVLA